MLAVLFHPARSRKGESPSQPKSSHDQRQLTCEDRGVVLDGSRHEANNKHNCCVCKWVKWVNGQCGVKAALPDTDLLSV